MAWPRTRPRILAVDYDSKGGCVISGVATSGHTLIGADRQSADQGQAPAPTASGRFALALDEPVTFAPHTVDGRRRRAGVQARRVDISARRTDAGDSR